MDFRTICQRLVLEAGIAGGRGDVPADVANPEDGQIAKVVNLVQAADTYIQNLYPDWGFLWAVWEETLPVDDRTPPLPTGFVVDRWDTRAFVLNPSESNFIPLTWLNWAEWRRTYRFGSWPAGQPAYITQRPDGSLILDRGTDAATDVFHGEGWSRPTVLVGNTDISRVPENFHRVILARAGVMYGQSEDAPELVSRFATEYDDQLEKLRQLHLPDRQDSMSQPTEQMMTVTR